MSIIASLLAARAALPSWLSKAIVWAAAFCLVLGITAIGVHGASSYLSNERAAAVALAKDEATSALAAKVNAATQAATEAQAALQAAAMEKLNTQKATDDAKWAAFEQSLPESYDYAIQPAPALPELAPAPPARPRDARHPAPVPAPAAQVHDDGFDRFVRDAASADRLLERATALH